MQEASPDIILGSVKARLNSYSYDFQIGLSTSDECGRSGDIITIELGRIIVNGINFVGSRVDNRFVENTLINKKAMFVVRPNDYGIFMGELYKLPFGVGTAVKVPVHLQDYLNQNGEEYLMNF